MKVNFRPFENMRTCTRVICFVRVKANSQFYQRKFIFKAYTLTLAHIQIQISYIVWCFANNIELLLVPFLATENYLQLCIRSTLTKRENWALALHKRGPNGWRTRVNGQNSYRLNMNHDSTGEIDIKCYIHYLGTMNIARSIPMSKLMSAKWMKNKNLVQNFTFFAFEFLKWCGMYDVSLGFPSTWPIHISTPQQNTIQHNEIQGSSSGDQLTAA